MTKYKLLRATFDQHMTWNEHITQLISSCYSALSVIRKLKNIAPYHTRKQLAETLILSKIDYCNSVYSVIPEYQMKRLQRIQNYFASFVLKRYAKIDDVKELGWLPIGKRLQLSILKLAHKALHKSDWPAYLRSRVFKSSYNLRSLTSLRIDYPYFNELNTFQDQATKSFSALPRDIRCMTDLSCSRVRRGVSWQINYNNTLYYSVKSSSKAIQSSLIGDTDHNTGISLLLSTSAWVILSPPIER